MAEDIKNVETYDPSKVSIEELLERVAETIEKDEEKYSITEVLKTIDLKEYPFEVSREIVTKKHITARNDDEMIKAIQWAAGLTGSDGVIIKSMEQPKRLMFKTKTEIDCEVLMVDDVDGSNAWIYLCVIRNSDGDKVPIGRTFGTSVRAKVGDVVRVSFKNMNAYVDKTTGKVWFNWVLPKVIEKIENKKSDTNMTAMSLNKKLKGDIGRKKWPKRYREILEDDGK